MFYVYVIKSRINGSLYVGYSTDLKRRLDEHNKGEGVSTRSRAPFDLVYYEAYRSAADAKFREHNLKRFSGSLTHLKRRIMHSVG